MVLFLAPIFDVYGDESSFTDIEVDMVDTHHNPIKIKAKTGKSKNNIYYLLSNTIILSNANNQIILESDSARFDYDNFSGFLKGNIKFTSTLNNFVLYTDQLNFNANKRIFETDNEVIICMPNVKIYGSKMLYEQNNLQLNKKVKCVISNTKFLNL